MRGTNLLVLAVLVLVSGCRSVSLPASGARVPVLLGAIERIGDRGPRRSGRKDIAPIKGKVSFRVLSVSSNSTETRADGVYNVHRSAVEQRTQSNLHSRISSALATTRGQPGVVVYLDAVRPFEYVHVGLGWTIINLGVEATGSVTRPAEGL
ncbi:hypothetical protein ACFL2T_04165 [Elusimicrobiota bacterium]